jgi:hypothetical protein
MAQSARGQYRPLTSAPPRIHAGSNGARVPRLPLGSCVRLAQCKLPIEICSARESSDPDFIYSRKLWACSAARPRATTLSVARPATGPAEFYASGEKRFLQHPGSQPGRSVVENKLQAAQAGSSSVRHTPQAHHAFSNHYERSEEGVAVSLDGLGDQPRLGDAGSTR